MKGYAVNINGIILLIMKGYAVHIILYYSIAK